MEGARGRRAPVPSEEFREVVPARAVLTELARGFLLERDHDPTRAIRFAATFLKEQTGTDRRPQPPSPPPLSPARRDFGRIPHGAVERPSSSLR
jgi:hypothetical protein